MYLLVVQKRKGCFRVNAGEKPTHVHAEGNFRLAPIPVVRIPSPFAQKRTFAMKPFRHRSSGPDENGMGSL